LPFKHVCQQCRDDWTAVDEEYWQKHKRVYCKVKDALLDTNQKDLTFCPFASKQKPTKSHWRRIKHMRKMRRRR